LRGSPPRARRRREDPHARGRRRSRARAAVPPRGEARLVPQSSEHRHGPWDRGERRAPLPRHGVRRGRRPSRPAGPGTASARGDAPSRRGSGRRVGGGAPGGADTSRHQVLEHPHHARRAGEGGGLRVGEASSDAERRGPERHGRRVADGRRRGGGHGLLHVPRADPGRNAGCPNGHLLAGGRALRSRDRSPTLRRADRPLLDARDRGGRASRAFESAARPSPRARHHPSPRHRQGTRSEVCVGGGIRRGASGAGIGRVARKRHGLERGGRRRAAARRAHGALRRRSRGPREIRHGSPRSEQPPAIHDQLRRASRRHGGGGPSPGESRGSPSRSRGTCSRGTRTAPGWWPWRPWPILPS
jgi:hypothetical protein